MTMTDLRRTFVRLSAAAVFVFVASAAASAEELRIMTSGAFRAALAQLLPDFERASGNTVVVIEGASMGDGPSTIPNRLGRGEAADAVILADEGVRQLIARGLVAADGRIELVRSSIAMAVRAGAPKPDISSVEALTQTLLAAKSIAYSSSASGVYLSTELFPRLGFATRRSGSTAGQLPRRLRAARPRSASSRSANSSQCPASTSSVRCRRRHSASRCFRLGLSRRRRVRTALER